MSRLDTFVKLPEVKDGVISDRSGALLEHSNVADAESIAAVMGYFVDMVTQCGESLGLSDPSKIGLSGPDLSGLIFIENSLLWTIYLNSSASQQEFEKKIDAMKRSVTSTRMGGPK